MPDAIGRCSSAYLTGESRFQVLQLRFEIRDGAMKFDTEMFGLKTICLVFRIRIGQQHGRLGGPAEAGGVRQRLPSTVLDQHRNEIAKPRPVEFGPQAMHQLIHTLRVSLRILGPQRLDQLSDYCGLTVQTDFHNAHTSDARTTTARTQ